jgi:hypothetical protein
MVIPSWPRQKTRPYLKKNNLKQKKKRGMGQELETLLKWQSTVQIPLTALPHQKKTTNKPTVEKH